MRGGFSGRRGLSAILLAILAAVLLSACGDDTSLGVSTTSGVSTSSTPSGSSASGFANVSPFPKPGASTAETESGASNSPSGRPGSASSTPPAATAGPGRPESQGSSAGDISDIFLLPEIKTGDVEFDRRFAENPIDGPFQFNYLLCSSTASMAAVCEETAGQWKNVIDTAYRAAMALADDAGRQTLKAEQDRWAAGLEDRLAAIESGPSDEFEKPLEALQLYRQRAAELCKAKYDLDGELPPFEGAVSSANSEGGPVG